jgi:predicted alpha/beta-hydrolase family hydrolase
VLAPGASGSADQAIIVAMAKRLDAVGFQTRRISYSRPARGGLAPHIEDVRRARDTLNTERMALVGRSFGGRVCTRLAAQEPPDALVLLGHPISPHNRPRPEDEAALEAVNCPTLVVQGERDVLGPLNVLQRIARVNRSIEIYVLPGVGHQFGARQNEGLERAAAWLVKALG